MNIALDWLEVLWTLSALVALAVAIWNLRDALTDRDYVRQRRLNGLLRTVTENAILEESMRVIKAGALIVAGLASLHVPNTASTTSQYFEAGVAVRLALVVVNVLILATGVQVRILRHRLREYHRDAPAREHDTIGERPKEVSS